MIQQLSDRLCNFLLAHAHWAKHKTHYTSCAASFCVKLRHKISKWVAPCRTCQSLMMDSRGRPGPKQTCIAIWWVNQDSTVQYIWAMDSIRARRWNPGIKEVPLQLAGIGQSNEDMKKKQSIPASSEWAQRYPKIYIYGPAKQRNHLS